LFALAVATASCIASSAQAEMLRWNLQDVRFNDGAIASGYFDLDTTQSSGALGAFDVKVTGGRYPTFEYTPANADAFGAATPFSSNGPAWIGASIGARSGRSIALRSFGGELTQAGTHALTSYLTRPGFGAEADAGEYIPGEPGRWVRTGAFTTDAPHDVAHGPLVQWTLHDVRFDNGGTVTGSFILDASTGAIEHFDLHSSMPCRSADACGSTEDDINDFFPCQPTHSVLGSSLCWGVYPIVTEGMPGFHFDNGADTPSGDHELNLIARTALSDRGGSVDLSTASGFDCCEMLASGHLITGTLIGTPVPEPDACAFAAAALGLLIARGMRHRAFRRTSR
jgi:hypothetical protein